VADSGSAIRPRRLLHAPRQQPVVQAACERERCEGRRQRALRPAGSGGSATREVDLSLLRSLSGKKVEHRRCMARGERSCRFAFRAACPSVEKLIGISNPAMSGGLSGPSARGSGTNHERHSHGKDIVRPI
jgi:hypothetical protein